MIKKFINKFKTSLVVKNSLWLISISIIQMIISLFVNIVVSRYLGVTNYGILNYGTSFISFFLSLSNLGLGTIIIKKIVEDKKKSGEILGTSILMRIISSFISIFLILLIITILKGNDELIIKTTFLQSLSLIFESFTVINLWYQANLKSKYTAIISFISYIFVAVYKITLVVLKKNVIWFAFSNSLTSFVICILLIIIYKKQKFSSFKFNISIGKNLLKLSYPFIFSSLMVAIYAQTDKIMIGSMLPDMSYVGLYAVTTTIVGLWNFVPTAIINSFQPSILNAKKISNKNYQNKIEQLYCIVFWICIAYSVFIAIFGKLIIFILYGNQYIEALPSLKIAIWGVTFSFAGAIREFWLVTEGRQKYAFTFSFLGVIVNISLNFVLIPLLGISGAAIATSLTQLSTGFIIPLIIKNTRESTLQMIRGITFRFNREE